MASNFDKYRWQKTSDTQWTANPQRGYTATIDYAVGPNPYTLTITGPGGTVTSWPTLRNAKNEFRRFLLDKPVA